MSDRDYELARKTISELVSEHIEVLARKRLAGIRVDAYGVVDATAWIAECQYFVEKVIRPRLSDDEASAVARHGLNATMTELIEVPTRKECARIEKRFEYDERMSGFEYERFCASLLERCGWKCELTKASGDQGVDIVARKNRRTAAIQCKKYSSPVGNAAVQEIVAARTHLRADYAVVVSNALFTRAAQELASTTDTLLIHHADLDRLEVLLSEQQ